ncbi:phospholipid-translocating P-type ATPase, flippase family protein [Tritrichomonas foetus]|uniref:Phospholipid-transporting ATPase n=1 Tax=Tritrichomonas foetus TaxID=1144522 RepID=A0A1J4J3N5_9EUKA|nr:phospholipid-translocating P-type ATPase, flippase family protein [Tritrichomonas foetus]|eukprot:OHS94038.1 phospholipid-translocating P-type ATPase, flippase family protein [Tritrichomonas foetus]
MPTKVAAGIQDDNPWGVIRFLYKSHSWPGQKDNFISTTRYTPLTFLPLTLFENFRCMTNIYFLIVLVISCLPSSPVSFILNLIPLSFVLAVSMIKSLIEDLLKHKQDKIRNKTPVRIYRFGEWISSISREIQVGDLVMQEGNCMVTCDMMFIQSSNPNQTINYSETQLNGESAVKTLSPHSAFKDKIFPHFLTRNSFEIHMPEPTRDLFKFDAKMVGPEKSIYPIAIHNILLRGMSIHYTDWFMGIALCTGHDCKIMKNQRHPPSKITQFDKDINWMIIGIFIFKMILIIILSAVGALKETGNTFPYLKSVTTTFFPSFGTIWMQYFVLYSYFIPISLVVTVEIIRLFHMIILMFDKSMYDEFFGWPEPHSANSIGQLGFITHILSDKTGTLTENIMELVEFVDENGKREAMDFVNDTSEKREKSFEFLKCLAICNTVIVYHNTEGKIEYNAESPDEAAFVDFASKCGVSLIDRQPEEITLKLDNDGSFQTVKYKIISVLPFNSDRKRMTIAVQKNGTNEIEVYTKGADNIIYERSKLPLYAKEVDEFAVKGFRTLVFAKRTLNNAESKKWIHDFSMANSQISNRDEAIAKIASNIESNLNCIGVSAIEDKLQPNVKEAIQWLRIAKISFWVLTGDKLETAIEIGKTSAVILPDSDMLIVSNENDVEIEKQLNKYFDQFQSFNDPVLILTAHATELVLTTLTDIFIPLAIQCKSVIFSRVSPFQKASIVAMIKKTPNTMTLAIGDGANDVGMIQEAHIGIGVQGREGSQAAQNSDFALPRFKHLIKLIAVHGHWTMSRFMRTAMFMLYKNFAFIMTYFWSTFDVMFSPTDFYDEFFMSMFNLVFTLFPPFAYGFFERDMTCKSLLHYPQLHRSVPNPMHFPSLIIYFLMALYHSLIAYYTIRFLCQNEPLQCNGNLAYIIIVMITGFQMTFWTNDWNGFVIASLCITLVLLFAFITFYSYFFVPSLVGMVNQTLGSIRGWFTIVVALFLAIFPPLTIQYIINNVKPTLSKLIMERECFNENDDEDFTLALKNQEFNPSEKADFEQKDILNANEFSSKVPDIASNTNASDDSLWHVNSQSLPGKKEQPKQIELDWECQEDVSESEYSLEDYSDSESDGFFR